MKEINERIGQRIKELRAERSISQEELAFLSGMHRTYVGQIERAEKNITLKSLNKIVTSFDLTLTEFFASTFNKD